MAAIRSKRTAGIREFPQPLSQAEADELMAKPSSRVLSDEQIESIMAYVRAQGCFDTPMPQETPCRVPCASIESRKNKLFF